MTQGGTGDFLARIESAMAGLQQLREQSARDLMQSQAERAEAAREGRLGPDWQSVQRRIDAGETTLSAIFTGQDDSPEGLRLLELSRDNLSRAAEEEQPPDEVAEELAAAEAQWDRLHGGRG